MDAGGADATDPHASSGHDAIGPGESTIGAPVSKGGAMRRRRTVMWPIIVALIYGGTWQPVEATVLSSAAAAMAPGTFVDLSTVGMSNGLLDPCFGLPQQGSSILDYLDSAVWNPINRQWYLAASVHGTCSAAKGIRYDDTTNTWSALPNGDACWAIPGGEPGSCVSIGHAY